MLVGWTAYGHIDILLNSWSMFVSSPVTAHANGESLAICRRLSVTSTSIICVAFALLTLEQEHIIAVDGIVSTLHYVVATVNLEC